MMMINEWTLLIQDKTLVIFSFDFIESSVFFLLLNHFYCCCCFLGWERDGWGICPDYVDAWRNSEWPFLFFFLLISFNFSQIQWVLVSKRFVINYTSGWWTYESWSFSPWVPEAKVSLVHQDFNCIWYKHPRWLLCSKEARHRMPPSPGN